MAEKKRIDKNKAVYAGVIIFLIIVFVVGFIYGLNHVLSMEGAYPPPVNEEAEIPAPGDSLSGVNLVERAKTLVYLKNPKTQKSAYIDIDPSSLETGKGEIFDSALLFIRDGVEKKVEEYFAPEETDFGEEITKEIFPSDVINPLSVDSFTCDYIRYQCPACGETSEKEKTECEKCGSEEKYNMVYDDEYTLAFVITDKTEMSRHFSALSEEEIKKALGENEGGEFLINSIELNPELLTVTFKINRLSEKLVFAKYSMQYNALCDVSLKGDYEPLGQAQIGVSLESAREYSFTWPALSLNKHTFSVEPKTTENLLATLTCSDPTQPVVTWHSSDESILTVDEEGYFKTTKKTGCAVVSASFEFQGETYTDECVVTNGYAVESAALSRRKAQLKTGDTLTLSFKISPSKATIQSVKWYSRDESVAAVSQQGVVTAVSAGKTEIYILTDDGYFRSTCEVTVK
ncbi:MAG: Ig-like domain-containing protein [Clostridiales bacterium]|nr:Ig-like domain-containing protein [Clostridiales bacterium]